MIGDKRQKLPPDLVDATQALLDSAALSGERVVSVARIVFCGIMGVRSWLVGFEAESSSRRLTTFAIVLAIAFSAASLAAVRRRVRPAPLVHLSVTVDAVMAFGALATNVLWPWPGYLGIINMPDLAVLVLLAFAAGLRGVPSAAALGGVLFGAAFVALCVLDRQNIAPRLTSQTHHYVLYGVIIATASAMAVVFAVRARRLAGEAARTAVHLDVAGRNLGGLLRDHHDLRALLASARLNAELLSREVGAGAPPTEAQRLAAAVRDDLSQVHAAVDDIKARTWGELAVLEGPRPVALGPAIAEVLAGLAPRFPQVTLSSGEAAFEVRVAGGAPTLRRILYNLVLNACEGDGRRAAARVEVTALAERAAVCLCVADDGPGFAEQVLAPAVAGRSTKAGGSGLGLTLVDALVRACRGELAVGNRPGGGAAVTVRLPGAPASSASRGWFRRQPARATPASGS